MESTLRCRVLLPFVSIMSYDRFTGSCLSNMILTSVSHDDAGISAKVDREYVKTNIKE